MRRELLFFHWCVELGVSSESTPLLLTSHLTLVCLSDGFKQTVGLCFMFGKFVNVVMLQMELPFSDVATMLTLRKVLVIHNFIRG